MEAGKAQTHTMAGGFALLADPDTHVVYQSTSDPGLFPSFPVWFDTGASGDLISYYIRSELGIPTTGETYEDIGIGGTETFDVSQSTEVLLVPSLNQPTYNDYAYADLMSSYSSYGNFNLQLRQESHAASEHLPGGLGYYNIMGTPVLNNYVMRVRPNNLTHQFDLPLGDGPYPMIYMETALLPALPAGLPVDRTVYIDLDYIEFTSGDPPVSVANNPVISDVKVADGGVTGSANGWLFDSGATVTIISKDLAEEIGLGPSSTVYSTAAIGGIGEGTLTLNGYKIDEMILPSSNETTLTFTNPVVYVIDWAETADLPVGLPGIFGMNLLDPSVDDVVGDGVFDIGLGGILWPDLLNDSGFDEWYVDPFGSQLVLVMVPEPASLALLGLGILVLAGRCRAPR